MEENLLIGDHLLVNKFVFGPTPPRVERALLPIGTIRRGDVVVFKYPEEPERDFIKRVIGLPGETVELRDKKVYINGTPLDEPYVHFLTPPRGAVGVPRGHVVRRARALRPGDGPARPVLRDGRQPRQLAGQPLLGLPAARLRQGQGARDLLVVRGRARGLPGRRRGRDRAEGSSRCSPTSSRARAGTGCSTRSADDQAAPQARVRRAAGQRHVASVRRVYSAHYKFKDAVQSTTQFSGGKSDEQMHAARILELAAQYDVPVTDANFALRREERSHDRRRHRTSRPVELVPGFQVPLHVQLHVDTFTCAGCLPTSR